MASEAEKLKALKLKEKAKALKEKEKAKALKEKEKAKALKEKEKAKALKEKEREKAKKAREKAKKAKDSKKGGTDDPSPPFYMFNLVYDTLKKAKEAKEHNPNLTEKIHPLFISFTEYLINTYLTSIKEYPHNVTLVQELYNAYASHIAKNTESGMTEIVKVGERINANVETLKLFNQLNTVLNGDSILAYLNWVNMFVYVFFIKKPETLNDATKKFISDEYDDSLIKIMNIIKQEDTTGQKNNHIERFLEASMFTQSSTLGRQPGFSLGEVAEALRNR
jgi:hypothetical protein